MLDPVRGPKIDQRKWTQARRVAGRLAGALLAEGLVVIVDGEFLTSIQRADLAEVLPPGVTPRFVTLLAPIDVAQRRARADPTRGLSRDPMFLRTHYEATAEAVSNTPSADLVLDTSAVGVTEAARAVVEWASRQAA